MSDIRPDTFAFPQDPETARAITLIRVLVAGACGCAPVSSEGGPVGAVLDLLKAIDKGARRRITLASGDRATSDELAIAYMIAEAQAGDRSALRLRAQWLCRRNHVASVSCAAENAADALTLAGVAFAPPPLPSAAANGDSRADRRSGWEGTACGESGARGTPG